MKKTMKKMASIIIFVFSFSIFTPCYAFADYRFNRGTTPRWGNGGRYEESSNEKSKIAGYVVFGVLFLATLGVASYWLSTKGPDLSGKNTEPAPEEGWRKSSSSEEVYYDKSEKKYVLIKKDDDGNNTDNSENKKEYNILSPF